MRFRTDRTVSHALIAFAIAGAALAPGAASACGWSGESPLDVTFDGAILGVRGLEPLLYDPTTPSWFYVPCGCELDEQKADWSKYLDGVLSWDDWHPILSDASLDDVDALILALKSDKNPRPPAYANSALFAKRSADERRKLISALYLVGFARRVEPFAHFDLAEWPDDMPKLPPRPPDSDALALQHAGESALAHARDEFLRQRYAFLLTRLEFYRRDWKATLAFFDSHAKELSAPSTSLSYRARYYAAGAALRDNQQSRGELELARVYAGFPDLAALATNDFAPDGRDRDAALALAVTPEEKAALWTLSGIRGSGVEALTNIAKLAPDSDLPKLLAVREIQQLENWPKADRLAKLEPLLESLASRPRNGWLYALVRGHSAAIRGDVPGARRWLDQAERTAPKNPSLTPMVTRQAAVSLVMALAHATDLAHRDAGDELVRRLDALPAGPVSKYGADNTKVREKVNVAVGAAWLASWTPKQLKDDPSSVLTAAVTSDPDRLLSGLRLAATAKTPFEKFAVSGFHRDALAAVAVQTLVDHGRFAEAATIAKEVPEAAQLVVDIPTGEHRHECYQCFAEDDEKLPQKALVAKLVALERTANGKGDRAAGAALEIGRILMHLTLLDIDRNVDAAPQAAITWFGRAYASATDRELKATAAYFAARCEMLDGKNRYYPDASQPLPVPKTWFPRLAELSDTSFEKEVLAECGHYRRWRERTAKP